MKNNRGFTLIEIIVSLALLSIISVGMISGLTSQFKFLTGTRDFTEELSDAQLRMEGAIVAVKKTLEEHGTPSGETSYTLFSGAYARTVAGYPRELTVDLGNSTGSFFTVVGSRVLDYPVATATVGLEFQPIDTTLFEYASSLYASTNITIVDPSGVNLTNIYRWYVSREGFNIPMLTLSTPEEVETGTKYPRFPDDYQIIPSAPNSTLASVVSRYPGKHIICTVTPAATSGKMGATAVSNPIFVSGLPYRSNLQLHLDASLISRESTFNEVRASGSDYYVTNWADVSGEGNDAAQGTTTRQPKLIETFIGDMVDADGNWFETYAKYAAFDGSNDYVNTTVDGVVDTSGLTSTAFVVARDAGADKFTIYTNDVPAGYVSFSPGWSTTSVTVGNSGTPVDVAEVIIYDSVLSAGDTDDVMDYLEKKYLPVTPTVAIRWLNDVTATVLQNSAYSPPATVSAYMTSGRFTDVPVTWSPAAIDTTTLGDKFSTCTAVADTTKHSTLTVHVVPPTPLTAIGDITVTDNGTNATLSAGALSPTGATATYQWQIYTAGTWQNIVGEISSVYPTAVWGQQYRVTATGTGVYTGSVTSNPITLNVTPLTAIGTPLVTGGGSYAELTSGEPTPSAATVSYQWQTYSSGAWRDVTGATGDVYSYAIWGSSYRVKATGVGAYTGTVYSLSCTPTQVPLTGIDDIAIYWDGTHFMLTAGAVAPSGATVTYQWQYDSSGWKNVSGGTASTLTATANTRYRVQATGTGMYTGTVTSAEITATTISLRSITIPTVTWNVDGTAILTAGVIDPAGATVTYQWQSGPTSGGSWSNIGGATASVYSGALTTRRYRVVVTGTGMYTDSATSDYVVPTKTALVSIGAITVTWDGDSPLLTAGAVNPAGATVTYQWQYRSGSNWYNITGATSASYTGTMGTQYHVVATGSGGYTGSVTSASVTPSKTPLTGIGNISISWSGSSPVLTAGAVAPSGATFTYQWWSGSGIISGATSSSYTGTAGTSYYVTATGTGAYVGTVTSSTVTPRRTSLTGIGNITLNWVGSTPVLTAGSVTPSGATYTYQWQSYSGGWSDIPGATSATYTGAVNTQYRVTAIGTGAYVDTVASNSVLTTRSGLTSIGAITVNWNSGTPTLTAGAVVPSGATFTYQWQSYSGGWNNIAGATSATYTGTSGTQYRVAAVGTGGYSGTVFSASVTPTAIQITGIGNITRSGSTLYPGAVTPSGAAVTYQWQRRSQGWFSDWSDWSTIDTDSTCSYTADTWFTDYQYRLIVTGSGQYYGSATSATYDS